MTYKTRAANSLPLHIRPHIWVIYKKACRLLKGNIFNSQIAEYLEQRFSIMFEHNRTMMRILLLNKYVTVEPIRPRQGMFAKRLV